jgi:hypothetical protein
VIRVCARCGKRGPTVKLSRDWTDLRRDGKGRTNPLCTTCFVHVTRGLHRRVS